MKNTFSNELALDIQSELNKQAAPLGYFQRIATELLEIEDSLADTAHSNEAGNLVEFFGTEILE